MKTIRTTAIAIVTLIFVLAGFTAASAGGTTEAPPRPSDEAAPATVPEVTTAGTGEWGTHSGAYDISAARASLGAIGLRTFKSAIPAIDFDLEFLDGTTGKLSDFQGKLVFLNFWATWCPPCRAEMPSMETVFRDIDLDKFVMLAVNVQEDAPTVRAFVQEFGYTFPVVLDTRGHAAGQYGVRGIPTTYIIGPDGVLLAQLVGTREWDSPDVVSSLNSILDEF